MNQNPLKETLAQHIKTAVRTHYNTELPAVEFQATRKGFEGDVTVVVFPMLRTVKANPVQLGETIGAHLVQHVEAVVAYNVVKGFLNVVLSDAYFISFFKGVPDFSTFGTRPATGSAVLVEYASPNTNKPLHLGHVRNVLLGYAVAQILKAAGKKVYKTQIINDRGIHICKSMYAWEQFGNGETPQSTGIKGDKLVGSYYVKFDQQYKKEVEGLIAAGRTPQQAKAEAPSLAAAQQMLRKWEANDPKTVALWKKMNGWVYEGFEKTYKNIGVDFNSYYYESNTYLLGKEFIDQGLRSGVFHKKEDGSVWCDLTEDGLDEKIVLRSDGTAVYITQDIGTAIQRAKDHPGVNGMIYTVGNEQDYHFKVLFLILQKLGFPWAENLYHLSYGMVDLPSGKMKSREGTVVDADDLLVEMQQTAQKISDELGKTEGLSAQEKNHLYRTIGLGALKYYILKVDPKKRILFNPKESVDFQGNTGPFVQYTYARIQSILRKGKVVPPQALSTAIKLNEKEKDLIKTIQQFPATILLAAENYSPALIANYVYELVKSFNSFYQNVPILVAGTQAEKDFRVALSAAVGQVTKTAFRLLGISVPEQM